MKLRDRRTKLRIASIAVGSILILLALFSHFAIGSSGRVIATQEEGVDAPIFSGDYMLFLKGKDTGHRESDGIKEIRISEPEKLLTKKIPLGETREIQFQETEEISLQLYTLMQQRQVYVSYGNGKIAMESYLFDLPNGTATSAPWNGFPFAKVGKDMAIRSDGDIQFWNLQTQNLTKAVTPPEGVLPFTVNEMEAVGRTETEIVRFDLEGTELSRTAIPPAFQDGVIRPFSNGWLLVATQPDGAVGLLLQNGTMQWQENLRIPKLTTIVSVASNEQQFAVLWHQTPSFLVRDVAPSVGLAHGNHEGLMDKIEHDVNAVSKGRLTSVAVHEGEVYYTDWLQIYKIAPGKELIPWIPTASIGALLVAGGIGSRFLEKSQSDLPRASGAKCPECGARREFSFCQRCGFQE